VGPQDDPLLKFRDVVLIALLLALMAGLLTSGPPA
jgi:hypothetical protein